MSRDWNIHKDLLKELYLKERLPLAEVKEKLEKDHGFTKSIRTYRTKFGEWDFRKNKSAKGPHVHYPSQKKSNLPQARTATLDKGNRVLTPSSQLSGVTMSPLPADANQQAPTDASKYPELKFPGRGRQETESVHIPAGAMSAQELSKLVWAESPYALEAFIAKWQDGGQYLRKVVELLEAEEFQPRCILVPTRVLIPGVSLFVLLQAKVSEKEQPNLITAMLNIRFRPKDEEHETYPKGVTWVGTLCSAFNTNHSSTWAIHKKNIWSSSDVRVACGNQLVYCALKMLAERRLSKLHWMLKPLLDYRHAYFPVQELRNAHVEYMAIIRETRQMRLTVNLFWFMIYVDVEGYYDIVMKPHYSCIDKTSPVSSQKI